MKKYINYFFSLNCARDLIPFFTACSKDRMAKEVTESFACFSAAKRVEEDIGSCEVVIPGDGVKPRTGAAFAFLSRANVHSIDPLMRPEWFNKELKETFGIVTKRLKIYKNKIEDVKIDCQGKRTILVLPHSHASMEDSIAALSNYTSLSIVNMPCCVQISDRYLLKDFIDKTGGQCYIDPDVWSPKRKIYTWKNIRHEN